MKRNVEICLSLGQNQYKLMNTGWKGPLWACSYAVE